MVCFLLQVEVSVKKGMRISNIIYVIVMVVVVSGGFLGKSMAVRDNTMSSGSSRK